MAIGFRYSAGFRISAILLPVRLVDVTIGSVTYMGMKEDVPEEDTKIIRQADIPVKNVGEPMA